MRLILLLTTLALSVVFIFLPDETIPKSYFAFSDQKVEFDTFVYFLFEHLIVVILALVILELEPKYKIAVAAYLIVQIIDTLDYVLFYGERWTPYLPTWNVLKVGIMGLAIFIDIRDGKTI